jgi:transcriptional regulator GlxA family with amidase domain
MAALVLGGVVVSGNQITARELAPDTVGAAPAGGWTPSQTTSPGADVVVAVVLGQSGTVASDALAPYEVFARSTAFSVYTVAEGTDPVPLTGGTSLVPAHTFDDVDAGRAPRPDLIVVPAVSDPTGASEEALRSWLTAQRAGGARIMGVCTGAEVLAATGMLDGHRATSHWSGLAGLRDEHPAVDWVGRRRWVEDRGITTTAGISSGVPGALEMVRELAGADEAARVAADLDYPGWQPGGSPRIPGQRFTVRDLPLALNAVLPWLRPTVGVALADGIGEIDLAAALEVYTTSGTARTLTVAATPTVTTRHGLVLTAAETSSETTDLSRVVVPGATSGAVDRTVQRWAADHEIPVDLLGASDGGHSFDAALENIAQRAGAATARSVPKMVEYPTAHLDLDGGSDLRAPALAALTLLVAAGAGALPAAVHRARRRRDV